MTHLEKYLNDHGIKQKWVAGKIGMDESQFCRIVSGDRRMPADVLVELMKTLSCEAHEIYDKWPVKEQESVAA